MVQFTINEIHWEKFNYSDSHLCFCISFDQLVHHSSELNMNYLRPLQLFRILLIWYLRLVESVYFVFQIVADLLFFFNSDSFQPPNGFWNT